MVDMVYGSAVGYEETVSQVTATNSVRLGDRRDHLGESYIYCFNAGGATIATGLGVKLITGASGYSIAATSLTDVPNPCVGVVKQTEIGVAGFGWVMTRGFHTVTVVTAMTADYNAIALGVDGKFIDAAATTSAIGTGAVAGYALDANSGTGGSVYAFIKTGF